MRSIVGEKEGGLCGNYAGDAGKCEKLEMTWFLRSWGKICGCLGQKWEKHANKIGTMRWNADPSILSFSLRRPSILYVGRHLSSPSLRCSKAARPAAERWGFGLTSWQQFSSTYGFLFQTISPNSPVNGVAPFCLIRACTSADCRFWIFCYVPHCFRSVDAGWVLTTYLPRVL